MLVTTGVTEFSEPRPTSRAGERRSCSPGSSGLQCRGPRSGPGQAPSQPRLPWERACPPALTFALANTLEASVVGMVAESYQACGGTLWGQHQNPSGRTPRLNHLEQRLCGVRKKSPYFPSDLRLSGLWAARPSAQARLWPQHSQCSDAREEDTRQLVSAWPLPFAPGGQLLEKTHVGWRRQHRGEM
ncbi:hypothetical protein HJG60_008369 [Phyllostomus discolor]|uniref:Uncharacterized protein n=1 Tax=Phyllostomus discolor TaxID=89673 RepID=A0A833YX05_9CHIR|nr:hypothetical protein HJG60_008369 [Phyllostomus discolor]